MPLVDLATAKRELRVLHDAEDDDITRKIAAAEEQAALFLGRNVYESQEALDYALAAAPDALSAATTAYQAALDAAAAVEVQKERCAAESGAKFAYSDALEAYRMVSRGIVATESIRTAVLLITASLWEHRGDEEAVAGIPKAAERFLWPYRVAMGV